MSAKFNCIHIPQHPAIVVVILDTLEPSLQFVGKQSTRTLQVNKSPQSVDSRRLCKTLNLTVSLTSTPTCPARPDWRVKCVCYQPTPAPLLIPTKRQVIVSPAYTPDNKSRQQPGNKRGENPLRNFYQPSRWSEHLPTRASLGHWLPDDWLADDWLLLSEDRPSDEGRLSTGRTTATVRQARAGGGRATRRGARKLSSGWD